MVSDRRRRPTTHKVLAIAAGACVLAAAGAAGAVTVQLDQSQVIDLDAPAGNVIIGNPTIADVTLISPRRMAVFGRGYGVTNLIITDRMGRIIMQQQVNVSATNSGHVSVYRGVLVHNFACSPRCERTPLPGEDKSTAFEPYASPYKDYADRSRADAAPASGTP